MTSYREVDNDRWGGVAQVCRWGIVLLAMTLVPGVAFLGQGLGRWLRTRSDTGWLPDAVHVEPGHRDAAEYAAAAPAVALATSDRPPSPAESAAMYDGSRGPGPIDATLARFDSSHPDFATDDAVRAAGHVEPAIGLEEECFAELERTLQSWGAVYYALETDRESGYEYRFECIMPAVGGSGAQERFTASGRTPVEAVRNTVRQVEQGRSRRP